MLNRLPKQLALQKIAKRFAKKEHAIWDIAVFGSVARGKDNASDIDIAILLAKDKDEAASLSLAQEVKESMEHALKGFVVDVKAISISDFFDTNFLARQGILAESYLLIQQTSLSLLLGFKTFALVKYDLKGLTYSQKKMLYYALKGRRGSKGMLQQLGGELISREILKIPIEASAQIEALLTLHKVHFSMESAMMYKKR